MKKITLKQTADFVGTTERTLYIWKTQNINGVKYHPPYGKHNLYIGARIASYLFLEENKQENNFEILKEALEDLKKCCKEEKLKPFENFINAVEKFQEEIRKD